MYQHTILQKNRPKHASMNINELIYVVDDCGTIETRNNWKSQRMTVVRSYKHPAITYGYTNLKNIQQEDINTMLMDALREKTVPTHTAMKTEGPITQEQIKTAIRKS